MRRSYRTAFRDWVSADKALLGIRSAQLDEATKSAEEAATAYASARNDLTREMLTEA